ncbi:MAG: DNA alkylation repair protein [Chloroflexi bacterium]|nr:DNA alkylation repair protein [Chloroflexota bacterium]
MTDLTADEFMERLGSRQSEQWLDRYAEASPIENRDGDQFIGVRMGDIFQLAKELKGMPLAEVEKMLESPVHEVRVGAVSIMDYQARDKKTTDQRKKELFELYIKRHDRINTWDLVDRSGFWVVGNYLLDRPRDVLYQLARSERMAERRTAIISTGQIAMKTQQIADTFNIAKILLQDRDVLIHKAVGWMLRIAGDIDRQKLLDFLDEHVATMPRITLRYATEHLDKTSRARYVRPRKAI